MITFFAVFGLIFSFWMHDYLKAIGRWDVYVSRWTDWLVLIPGYGGMGCLLWVTFDLCRRWLP